MAMLEMQQCTMEGCENPALINRMGPISRKQNGDDKICQLCFECIKHFYITFTPAEVTSTLLRKYWR